VSVTNGLSSSTRYQQSGQISDSNDTPRPRTHLKTHQIPTDRLTERERWLSVRRRIGSVSFSLGEVMPQQRQTRHLSLSLSLLSCVLSHRSDLVTKLQEIEREGTDRQLPEDKLVIMITIIIIRILIKCSPTRTNVD